MPVITWDDPGRKFFEQGLDRGVLYPTDGSPVPWNGLLSVTENVSGGESKAVYYDGNKFLNYHGGEDFAATLEAFTYPDEFGVCDGSQPVAGGLIITKQRRVEFGLTYRTQVGLGDDLDHGYKIHLIYNALAAPSQKARPTRGQVITPTTLSWDISTRPVKVSGFKPSAYFIIESLNTDPETLDALESMLYGTPASEPFLPTPQFLVDMFEDASGLIVVDNGDGTWTASGDDGIVDETSPTSFQLTHPSIVILDADTYQLETP